MAWIERSDIGAVAEACANGILRKSLGRKSVNIMRLAAVIAIAAIGGFAASDALHAQSYPTRAVTLIVPSAAGGGTDTIARLIGDQLAKQLGQSFVVENRTGGGMLVGTTAAAKAAPDGYTLLVGLTGNMSVNPSLFANLPYDPLADFTPVAMLANYPFLVVVNNDLPAKSIKELIALLKSQPGKIDYASAGNGTGQHLAPELFKMMTGTEMGHVPYRGAQPAYQDVISGRVPVFFDNMSTAMSLAKGGKVRALAVTSKTRSALMPELPTVDEAGVPGYQYYTWFGLWAPRERRSPSCKSCMPKCATRSPIRRCNSASPIPPASHPAWRRRTSSRS